MIIAEYVVKNKAKKVLYAYSWNVQNAFDEKTISPVLLCFDNRPKHLPNLPQESSASF